MRIDKRIRISVKFNFLFKSLYLWTVGGGGGGWRMGEDSFIACVSRPWVIRHIFMQAVQTLLLSYFSYFWHISPTFFLLFGIFPTFLLFGILFSYFSYFLKISPTFFLLFSISPTFPTLCSSLSVKFLNWIGIKSKNIAFNKYLQKWRSPKDSDIS